MYLASHKMDIGNGADPDQTPQNVASDQGLHSLLTGNSIRNRIKMLQDTCQLLNDKMTSLIAKDCIFLRKYGLIVALSVQNGFKSAFLVVLSLPQLRSHYNCVAFDTDMTTLLCVECNHIPCFPRQLFRRITITCIWN